MPPIRMKANRTNPERKAGRLYNVPFPESWELVRDGHAEHEYVPESKVDGLLVSEPSKKAPANGT